MGKRKGHSKPKEAIAHSDCLERAAFADEELDDDLDRFQAQRDFLALDRERDDDSDGGVSDDAEEVMGLDDDDEEEEDEEDDDDVDAAEALGVDDDDDDKREGGWGRGRGVHYSTDFVDPDFELGAEDEEAADLEEQEAQRLQKLRFDNLDADDFAPLTAAATTRDKAKSKKAGKAAAAGAAGAAVEVVPKDMSALTEDERLDILASAAPELLGLCQEFEVHHSLLKDVINPLLSGHERRDLQLSPECLHTLQIWHVVVPLYLMNVTYYLYLHGKGGDCAPGTHPCVGRLVELRKLLLDLEKRSGWLLEDGRTLLELIAQHGTGDMDDDDDDDEKSDEGDDARKDDDGSSNSEAGSDNASADNTEESESEGELAPAKTGASLPAAPFRYTQQPVFSAEQQLRSQRKRKRRLQASNQDFDDKAETRGGFAKRSKNADGVAVMLPPAPPPEKKRSKRDAVLDEQADELFQSAVALAEEKKRQKKAAPALLPEDDGRDVVDAATNRAISWNMKTNKGLTPSRKKEVRNPRKKYRNRHEKAEKNRKGGIMTMRQPEARYSGEKTGIRTTLKRGTALH